MYCKKNIGSKRDKDMSPQELTAKTVKDLAKRKKQKENQFYGYQKATTIKRRKKWNVKFGGTRW